MNIALEAIGVLGGVFLMSAFVQVALNKWNGRSFWYEAFNFIGSILLVYYTVEKRAYTNVVLNLIAGTIALYFGYQILIRKKIRKKKKKKRS